MFLAFLLCAFTQNGFSAQIQGVRNDRTVYDNWLSIQTAVEYSPNRETFFQNRVSERYLNLYEGTNNIIYLNFALHEALREKRQEMIDKLSDQERREVSHMTEKLMHGDYNDDYFSLRDFSAADIYTFHGPGIPGDRQDQARELLDHWLSSLPQDYQENSLKAGLKAQALVLGYDKLNDFDKVFEVGQYLTKSHPFPNSSFTFYLFNIITYASRVRGYYSEALSIYTDILFPVAEALGSTDRYLIVKMDYALTLIRIGNVNAAKKELEDVYSQGIQNLDPRYRPALFNNLAISYLNSGEFDRYVQFQLEAFEFAREEENFDQQLKILRNLFIFYRRQNDTQLALNYFNQALEISQQYHLPEETAGILLSLGIYKRETENLPGEALQHFYDALELSQESNSYQQHYNSYIELARTYHVLDNPIEAENYFKEAIAISNSREDVRNHTMAIVQYSNMLTDLNRYNSAANMMQEVNDDDLDQIPFEIEVLGRNVQIKLHNQREETDRALEVSSTIIEEVFEWVQESTDMQTGHMRMDKEFLETFQLHTELLRRQGEYEQAIAVTERFRNLSRTGFYNNPLLKSQILSEEELIRDYNLSNRIQDLRNRYARANEDQKVYLSNQLAEAISERNRLQNQAFPNYNEGNFDEVLPRAMKKLKSDQMVIYFSVFDNQIFQFFVTRSGVDMKAYPAEDEYLELLEQAVAGFGHGSTDLNLLHDVYNTFYAENIPKRINHLYVIPDGVFYRIPIEILPVSPVQTANSYGSSTYLIEEYSVSYLNTLSDLVTEPVMSDFSYDMAGFGVSNFTAAGHPDLPDLPFSPGEITHSAAMIDKFTNNRFFIDEGSTESNFREIAGKAKIIHLATHSRVNDESPLFSSLYLFSGSEMNSADSTMVNENDGIIHAYELFDLNLNANLIFLSSCESGTGGYLRGSGILGFSRALTYAGAQSLSINLWPIRDQTASEISIRFYEALNSGDNKAEALRKARLSYLNNTNSDPYLWGAFILYGNIESPINNNQFLTHLLISGLLITGLFFVAIFVYQKKSLIKSWIL